MKILITGATGFIGSHLIEALSASDDEVYALVRDPGRLAPPSGRPVWALTGDLLSIPDLPAGLDVVYHLAGLTKALKKKDYYTVNRKGTASLLDALERQGLRPKVVVLSSVAAGGPSEWDRGRAEDDPVRPVTPYGESKRGGEEEALARKERFPIVILRAAAVYGPRDTDFFNLFRYIQRGIVLSVGFKRRLFSLCFVKDLVRALRLAAITPLPSGEILNIADPEPYTLDQFGRAAATALGVDAKKIVVPFGLVFAGVLASEFLSTLVRKPSPINRSKYRDYRQPGWVADVAKARARLGFESETLLEAGMRETAAWYLDNGWLSRPSGSRSSGSRTSPKTSSKS
jgi:nucleoside-diphosphate-sugar epimerase